MPEHYVKFVSAVVIPHLHQGNREVWRVGVDSGATQRPARETEVDVLVLVPCWKMNKTPRILGSNKALISAHRLVDTARKSRSEAT